MTQHLKKLYNELILERQRDPNGFVKREDAQFVIEAYNPVCGDNFKIYLDFHQQAISKITYHGYGCALSKASTSLLVEELAGLTTQQALTQINNYFKNLGSEKSHASELLDALAMAKEFPGREQCVVLTWNEVLKFMQTK